MNMRDTEVLLFGVLAEVAGKSKTVVRSSGDLDSLMESLYTDYPRFREYNFRVSVNHRIVKDNITLSEGDEVALLPPFAGG